MMFDVIDQIRQYWLKNNLIDGSIIIFTQSRPITLYRDDFIYIITRFNSITIFHPIFQKKKKKNRYTFYNWKYSLNQYLQYQKFFRN